jgi:spore coat protein U-like protein
MKKTLALIASTTAVAFAAPVSAQSTGNQNPIVHELEGEVAGICTLADFQASPIQIDFGMLSDVDVGQQTNPADVNGMTVICNDPDGGTLSITSQNQGILKREGSNGGAQNTVGYTVVLSGGSGLGDPTGTVRTLGNPVQKTFAASSAFLNGQSFSLSFRANGVRETGVANANQGTRTTVFAGIYTDTVTVAVTAN